ncbi:MAG: phosphotransferase, partial [Nocardioides sp.]
GPVASTLLPVTTAGDSDISRWTDPAWLAEVRSWTDHHLARLGLHRTADPTQPHLRSWATALRVPTSGGVVWFKASQESLAHEAAVVELLARRAPEHVRPLLAADTGRGWMLMEDAGERLRELVVAEASLQRWHKVLDAAARISLAVEDDVEALLALGVPDGRLPTLVDGWDALMDELDAAARFREAREQVASLANALAAYEIRETLQHDDLHDGQVFVRDGRHWVIDWGDAVVSHPFFVLAVVLEGQLAWGLDDVEDSIDTAPFRDTFLRPYAEAYPHLTQGDLVEAAQLATRLGWAARAVNGHLPDHPGHTTARLEMFVDGRTSA